MSDKLQQLVEKAKTMKAKIDACPEHVFRCQGFSKIAHPEMGFEPHRAVPNVKHLEDIQYSSWYCSCGLRVSTEEMHEIEEQQNQRRRNLESHSELMRRYKVDD